MSHAYETFSDAYRNQAELEPPRLTLNVIFTDPKATRQALRAAYEFGRGLAVRIRLIVAQVVPYPLALERPAVHAPFTQEIVDDLLANDDHDVHAAVYLCRDEAQAFQQALTPGSIVLIGSRRRWFRNSGTSLARKLLLSGHKVILIDEHEPILRSL